jgi:anti-sigma-K factor RskA
VDTPMNHSEYEQLAAGYVLGALEPDDEHVFQRHLGGCSVCEANVRELEGVVGTLAYAAPPVEPPDTVWAGIQRELRPEARQGAPPRSRRPGSRLVAGLAAAAATDLLAVLSVWNLNLREQNELYRERVAALERAAELVNEPNATTVSLDEGPPPPGAQATVVASTPQDRGVLIVEGLPPLQRGRVYELWGVPEGRIDRAQKALVFIPLRRQGVQALEFRVPIQPGTVFAITEEPGPDGSEKPTSQPLLAGAPATA